MRWYRQYSRQLLGHEPSDFVSFPDEEVIDAAHDGDARVGDRCSPLVRGPELVVLGSDDERADGHLGKRARREVHILRADPHERDRVGRPAASEIREDLERAEAVANETERQGRRERPRVIDRRGEVLRLRASTGPFALALPDAAEVDAQRVPAALRTGARDRGDERVAGRAAVWRQRMRG